MLDEEKKSPETEFYPKYYRKVTKSEFGKFPEQMFMYN